jgi:hypothetical protein
MIARAIILGKYQEAINHRGIEFTEESVFIILKVKKYF